MKNPASSGAEAEFGLPPRELLWQKAAENLNSIAALKIFPDQSPTRRDADEVVAMVAGFNAPVSIADLALKLAWDPDRLAQALSNAGERGLVAFSKIKDQTFVGLPAFPGSPRH